MTTRADIIAEARKWIGTPYHHQQRALGLGVDCVGILIGVAHALNLSTFDTFDYGRTPNPDRMLALLREHMTEIAIDDAVAGDAVLFRFTQDPQHLAILTDGGRMIHAYATVGECVETDYDRAWRRRAVAAFAFPQVS